MLHIYNTLSKQKQAFKSIEPQKVKMYVCGMTVYDDCHLGHARVMVVFDMVRDWLQTLDYQVTYVRNITDIDDKIINKAIATGQEIGQITNHYIQRMNQDAALLGVKRPNFEPRATEYVQDMQMMIAKLFENGLAYQKANKNNNDNNDNNDNNENLENNNEEETYLGDVYFAVRKFTDYGKLSGKKLEDLQQGERVTAAEISQKEDPLDFVLWKMAKKDEPHEAQWDSPWGVGRPGWHIECSAMSCGLLGEHFDIHGGGLDLQFPHHENEIAQTVGATQRASTLKNWVNVWMHNGFVRVDDEKMSKSLGNFFTIREILEKYSAEVVRFFILRAHYRSPLNYSDTILDDAKASLRRLYNTIDEILHQSQILHSEGISIEQGLDLDSLESPELFTLEALNTIDWSEHYAQAFRTAMNDDFNTAQAIHVLFEMVSFIHQIKQTDWAEAVRLCFLLKNLAKVLGLMQINADEFLKDTDQNIHWIEEKIKERTAAKAAKNWQAADDIRNELLAKNIILKDLPNGLSTWQTN